MKRLLAFCLFLIAVRTAQAQSNLLINGDLESTPAAVLYDGSDPSAADDVPGWILSLGAVDGSNLLVSEDMPSNVDLDLACGPSGGAMQTEPSSRPPVTSGSLYIASVTYDNYFADSGVSYFIDWYGGGGFLLGSIGGPLGDPNGALTYEPLTQLFSIMGTAPAGTASAGVRFTQANPNFNGAAADNFKFGLPPILGDFDDDGDIDATDYLTLSTNLHTDLSGLTTTQSYIRGDMTRNLLIDANDFRNFRIAFDDFNGVAAFEAMLAAIPEPSAGALAAFAWLGISSRRRFSRAPGTC